MRRLLSVIAATALIAGVGLATSAGAAVVEWEGTLVVNVGTLPQFIHFGTGVATVNGSAGGINTLSVHQGLTFTGGNNVAEVIPLTGPENPTLISLRGTGLRIGNTNYSSPAVFNGLSGGALGTQNTGRPPGNMKMCILFPGCGNYLPIPFGTINNVNAVGVGGLFTVNTFSKGNGFKLSVQGAPWTIGLAQIKNITTETPNGAIVTYTKTLQGVVHGPASATSPNNSAAAVSGLIQIVTPVFIETSLGAADTYQAVWADFRLHIIPEPGLLLLLGAGVSGLLLLGRSRMRK